MERERKTREKEGGEGKRKKETFRWRHFPITVSFRRKEYNLSDAKKQHIARKDIPCIPLEGNRAARSGG